MKLKLIALALLTTSVYADEIAVDLERLSNVSTVQTTNLSIESEFIGYELDEGKYRYARDVELDGLDWAFWYGDRQSVSKPSTYMISEATEVGEIKTVATDSSKNATSNRYHWQGGSSEDYLTQLSYSGLLQRNGGFSFQVQPESNGKYSLELYTHNWLSSADVTACVANECITIQNDISFHMTSIKNTITFEIKNPDDVVDISFNRHYRQFDFETSQGYHGLEAIQLKEVQ